MMKHCWSVILVCMVFPLIGLSQPSFSYETASDPPLPVSKPGKIEIYSWSGQWDHVFTEYIQYLTDGRDTLRLVVSSANDSVSRRSMVYNDQGLLSLVKDFKFENGSWKLYSVESRNYDSHANLSLSSVKRYDFNSGTWKISTGESYSYSYAGDNIELRIKQVYDTLNLAWVNSSKEEFTFNAFGHESESFYKWDRGWILLDSYTLNYEDGICTGYGQMTSSRSYKVDSWYKFTGSFFISTPKSYTRSFWYSPMLFYNGNDEIVTNTFSDNGSYVSQVKRMINPAHYKNEKYIKNFDSLSNETLYEYLELDTNDVYVIKSGVKNTYTYGISNSMLESVRKNFDPMSGIYQNSERRVYSDHLLLIAAKDSTEGSGNPYPNPNRGSFTIDINFPCKVTIHNLQGYKLFERDFDFYGMKEVNADLNQGVYIVTCTSGGEKKDFRIIVY